jgi:hypothetical protein
LVEGVVVIIVMIRGELVVLEEEAVKQVVEAVLELQIKVMLVVPIVIMRVQVEEVLVLLVKTASRQ